MSKKIVDKKKVLSDTKTKPALKKRMSLPEKKLKSKKKIEKSEVSPQELGMQRSQSNLAQELSNVSPLAQHLPPYSALNSPQHGNFSRLARGKKEKEKDDAPYFVWALSLGFIALIFLICFILLIVD